MRTIPVFIALCALFAFTNCASIFKADLNSEFEFDDIQELRERRKADEGVDDDGADYPTGEDYKDETGQGDEEEKPEVKPTPAHAPAPGPASTEAAQKAPELASEQVPESDPVPDSDTVSVGPATSQEQAVLVPAEPASPQQEPAPVQQSESNNGSIRSNPLSTSEESTSPDDENQEENEEEESSAPENAVKQPAGSISVRQDATAAKPASNGPVSSVDDEEPSSPSATADEDLPEEPAISHGAQAPVAATTNGNGVRPSQRGLKPAPGRVGSVRGNNQAPNRVSAGNAQSVRTAAVGGRNQVLRRGVRRGVIRNSKPVLRGTANKVRNGSARQVRAGNPQSGRIRPGVQRLAQRPALRNRG